MRKFLFVLFSITLMFSLTGCGKTAKPAFNTAGKQVKVVATFYPLYNWTKEVGGDKVQVTCLVPTGVEPHDWEPAPKDLGLISQANVFIYNGLGLEGWVQKYLPNIQGTALKTVEFGSLLHPDEIIKGDPHIWLDPVLAQRGVAAIRDALIAVDPANSKYYTANARAYQTKLAALDQQYRQAAAGFKEKDIVTSHEAFAYLARRYGLQQVSVMGLAPDAEPSPGQMKQVVEFAKAHGVKTIFFETLVNPKLADTIAQEIGAKTAVLNPLEGLTAQQTAAGQDYLSVMSDNLANLKTALGGGQ